MSTIVSRGILTEGDTLATMSVAHAAPAEMGAWSPDLGMPRGALVTGAGRRIGRAVATELGRLGWRVALHHNTSSEAARGAAEQITRRGGRAAAVAADFESDPGARLMAAAGEAVGPIGLLINNASIYEDDSFADMAVATWERHQRINALTPVMLTQAFVARLPAAMQGAVINIVDSRVLGNRARHFSYAMSKASLWTATRLLARELAPRVRVNAIGPGPTLPEEGQSEEAFEERCADLPLQRPATLEEMKNAVRFLVATRSLTGQMLALDGGDHMIA